MVSPLTRSALAVALLLASGVAAAQDSRIAPSEDRTPRRVATTGYTLAVSWTPEYCHARRPRRGDAPECRGPAARGFTLHGLWPDGADPKVWPQYCRATQPLTPAEIRAGEAATPSPQLLQHEWDKHGSCMAPDAARYFAEEGRLYRTVRAPDMASLAGRRDLTVGAFERAFAAANPGLAPEMMRLNVNQYGWLKEVWLCLSRDRRPERCPAGADEPAPGTRLWVQRP